MNGALIFAREVRNQSSSLVTGDSTGALSRQLGSSSSSARGSITAPEIPWWPISPPFSITRISSARPAACARARAESPGETRGPRPTKRTSTSSRSRSGIRPSASYTFRGRTPDGSRARRKGPGAPVRRSFASDNTAPVAPEILRGPARRKLGDAAVYGEDPWTARTRALSRHFGEQTEVYFAFNGTGANVAALSSFFRPWEAVLAPATAHLQRRVRGTRTVQRIEGDPGRDA